jgi:hypothetical protein
MVKYLSFTRCVIVGIFMLFFFTQTAFAQSNKGSFKINGTVWEKKSQVKTTIPYATVSINEYGINVSTNINGKFIVNAVPGGRVTLSVKYLGMVTLDTVINVNADLNLDLYLAVADFRLDEVNVTAKSGKDGQGTSSKISRTAIDHLQANNLADVMALLPGGKTINPVLTNATQINIRNVTTTNANVNNLNGFGTVIMMNGAPVANNANLQTLSPSVSGGSGVLGGGASPNAGFDARGISMDNVESVEVIRGVPGVEYGDVTSGVVIVNTKAGNQPLKINAKTNPNVYQVSATKGTDLGGNKGALNLGLDYAHNTTDPVASYAYYERFTANAMYSNLFLNNRLKSNTSLDLIYGKDTRKANPDDILSKTSTSGRDLGFIFNTNGNLAFNNLWLRNINYVGRVGYTTKNSFYETEYTSATAPYSMTYTDGAVLSNKPNTDLFDVNGKKITNISAADQGLYALSLPSTYVGRYDINGKELNTYFKAIATFFNKIGGTNNKWLLGADFKSDKNYGDGKRFSNELPPRISNSNLNASFRQRVYKDIPGVNQLGLFAEEHFNTHLGTHSLEITAGARYDRFSGNRDALSPRLNASFEVIPGTFKIRGAYGKLAKAPSMLYLHPEDAYYEYININETASAIPVDEQVYMTTTRIFNTENPDLKIAKNQKSELGFDLSIKQYTLRVTAFRERMENGYALGNTINTFRPVTYNQYVRSVAGGPAVYQISGVSNTVLAKYFTPTNNQVSNNKGVEVELDLGRFPSIASSFSVNGAWTQSESYNNGYTFFDDYTALDPSKRTHIGLYEQGMQKRNDQEFVTSLRSTHNIPRIGFVVTLTTQVIWNQSNWNKFGNDSIPVSYIDKNSGTIQDFDSARKNEPEFKSLIRTVNTRDYIKESYPPLLAFNLNLTKEIADYMRVSFFANNMFRSYPIAESKRNTGTYIKRNGSYFFGLELALTLK